MSRARSLPPGFDLPPPDTLPAEERSHPDYELPLEGSDRASVFCMHPRDVRKQSPYQAGDVVPIRVHGPDGGPRWSYRHAAIESVGAEYLNFRAYFVPKYRVRLLNKDGRKWSGQWQYAYPGDITRGFETMREYACETA